MSIAKDNDIDITKLKLEGSTEVFLIAQGRGQHDDLTDEEHRITKEMVIKDIRFESGVCVYKNKDDAIAVAKKLIENNPLRHLAVISAIA